MGVVALGKHNLAGVCAVAEGNITENGNNSAFTLDITTGLLAFIDIISCRES